LIFEPTLFGFQRVPFLITEVKVWVDQGEINQELECGEVEKNEVIRRRKAG